VLRLGPDLFPAIVAHMYAGLPDEACGLLVGDPATAAVARFVACANAARSSRVYAVAPRDLMQADREATADGFEVIGVVHSHTHTDAFPSPTDVAQVPDPGWHYVIVSLKRAEPSLRSYRIVDGTVTEEPVIAEAPLTGWASRVRAP
jgi:proteasome lid subunit RPN8/RPN11